jgi:hypothetical protein
METLIKDKQQEEAAVLERFEQWVYTFQNEDVDYLEDVLSEDPDMVIFGTDAQERWIGKNEFIAAQ